jgi:hypothetical protein
VPDDGRWRRADFLAALLLAVGVTVQVAGTLFMLHRFGHVYQEKGSLALVWQNGLETLSQCASDSLWHVPLLVAVPYLFVTGGRRAFSPRGPVVTSVGFLLAGFVLLLLPQWVIYGNAASCGVGRYLNPGSLFVVFALAVGLRLFVAQPADWKGFTVGLLLGAAFLPHLRTRGGRLRQDCARFARASVRFQDRLNAIAALTAQRPGAPVVFTVDDPRTYEPIFSVRGYLARLLGPRRRFYLRLVDGVPDETPLERKLRACLQNISQEGDSYFDRWASLPRPAPGLIEVSFTKAGAKPLSANAVRILE